MVTRDSHPHEEDIDEEICSEGCASRPIVHKVSINSYNPLLKNKGNVNFVTQNFDRDYELDHDDEIIMRTYNRNVKSYECSKVSKFFNSLEFC